MKPNATGERTAGQHVKRNASRKVFDVKAVHCRTACKKDSQHCMIADAIAEAMPWAQHILVDAATIRWSKGAKRFTYLTPPSARVAILDFDAGKPVKPFRLVLNEGYSKPRGWKAQHPHSDRAGKKFKKTGISAKHLRPERVREFGMRRIVGEA